MSTKILFFMLSAVLLVQCTYGNAIGGEEQKAEDAQYEFTRTVFSETLGLIDKAYSAFRNDFEPLFTEVAAIEEGAVKTEVQQKVIELKALSDRMSKMDDAVSRPAKAEFIDELKKIMIDLKKLAEQAADQTDFDKKVLDVKISVQAAMESHFLTFADNVVNAAEKYWNSMSPEKQATEQKFHDAVTQLKNEPDIHKKGNILKGFLTFEDPDAESDEDDSE